MFAAHQPCMMSHDTPPIFDASQKQREKSGTWQSIRNGWGFAFIWELVGDV